MEVHEAEFEISGYISVKLLSEERKFTSGKRGIRVNRVKMTEKWGEIQGKLDLVRVSGEFLSCPSLSYWGLWGSTVLQNLSGIILLRAFQIPRPSMTFSMNVCSFS